MGGWVGDGQREGACMGSFVSCPVSPVLLTHPSEQHSGGAPPLINHPLTTHLAGHQERGAIGAELVEER